MQADSAAGREADLAARATSEPGPARRPVRLALIHAAAGVNQPETGAAPSRLPDRATVPATSPLDFVPASRRSNASRKISPRNSHYSGTHILCCGKLRYSNRPLGAFFQENDPFSTIDEVRKKFGRRIARRKATIRTRRWARKESLMTSVASKERRSGRRFPIRLKVAYRVLLKSGKQIVSGDGMSETVNMSHTGVLLELQGPFPEGATADLSIDWPFCPKDAAPLRLRLWGLVARCDRRGTAIKVARHGFHMKELSFSAMAGAGGAKAEERSTE